ncbi:O-acyltransferase like protein [Anopheles ziemanni]|uniref:O-acyltransferase like protein n=1 Tax=Anopheles coustani TaxID=139045 RepID=UPI00265942FA|nr:O-acyltransferase like protein [Anopheles coustani]XP_058169247.1 O-acyltransferase like protein [Anopheles ziemanni]
MFASPTIARLRDRQAGGRKAGRSFPKWFGFVLLLTLPSSSTYGQRTEPVAGLPFPDWQTKLHSTPGRSGDRPTAYVTPDTQSVVEFAAAGDHKSAARRDDDTTIVEGTDAVLPDRTLSPTEGTAGKDGVGTETGHTGELVLPSYETSSVRSAGPPVYKYTDNVFRVPKRKAKKSYPETAVPDADRKPAWTRAGNRARSAPLELAAEGSSASVAYVEGHALGRTFYELPGGGHETPFQLFTNLFDHGNWNILELKARIGEQCAGHLGLYLRDLRHQRAWALKASDSSGRYGSQYFFGNEFWMGSLTFCDEVNRVLRHTPMPAGARQLEMRFFVAKVSVQLERLLSAQSSSILLGQCLPKSCSVEDVTELLRSDPILNLLNNGTEPVVVAPALLPGGGFSPPTAGGLTVLHVRPVPGSYNPWADPKVFGLVTVVAVLCTLIAYASCGAGSQLGERKAAERQLSRTGGKKGAGWKVADGHHLKLDRAGDALEMHKINVESNNNVSGNGQQQQQQQQMPGQQTAGGLYKDRKGTRFTMKDILGCFDVGPNAASILSVEQAGEDSLTCVHGLRLYSLLWTVLVHTYLQLFAVSENRFGRKIAERSFLYQLVGNASFSVDTFFFISGLLIVYLYLKSVAKGGQPVSKTPPDGGHDLPNEAANPNATTQRAATGATGSLGAASRKVGLSILYRYLRLTPVYLFTIVSNELILKWTYDRSVFTPGIIDHITCDRFWWRNVLYVNNWYPFTEMCMIWSWYLANDMQFYVIAIVLLMISSRNFRLAVGLLFLCLGGSWLLSIYFSLHYRYTHKVAEPFESFDILYDKPWQRIGPYIVGMITGYILYRRPTGPRIVPPVRLLLWTLSTGTMIALIFGVWNGELSVHWTAWYVSVGHTAWGLALMWITLSCCWGYSRFVNGLLSYRGFFPLSRLAYCTYLIHPVVMMATSFQLEAPMHLQHVIIITAFFGNAVISFLIAFGMSLMFEAPVIKLLKLFFQKPQSQSDAR